MVLILYTQDFANSLFFGHIFQKNRLGRKMRKKIKNKKGENRVFHSEK